MTSVQSFAGWKRAFDHAKDTEAEGAKYFEGFFKKLRRTDESLTFVEDKSSSIGTALSESLQREKFRPTYSGEVEKEVVERGGFCQPASLASFFKKGKSADAMLSVPILENAEQTTIASSSERSPPDNIERENGVARQICRAWLKNTYLQLGSPCKNVSCDRRHLIESTSIGSLYKDYSFKGLSTVQRNSIISQVQLAAITTTTTKTKTTGGVVQSEAATAVTKPSECKVVEKKSKVGILKIESAVSEVSPVSINVAEHDMIPMTAMEIISKHSRFVGTEVDCSSRSSINAEDCKSSSSSHSSDIESMHDGIKPSGEIVDGGRDDVQNLKALDAPAKSRTSNNFGDDRNSTPGILPGRLKRMRKPWMPIHKKITY